MVARIVYDSLLPVIHSLIEFRQTGGISGEPTYGIGRFVHFYREFLFKMDYFFNYGMPQWYVKIDRWTSFLRLDKHFLGRHRYYHFRLWLRYEWASYIRDLLLSGTARSRPYLRSAFLEKMVTDHIEGRGNYTEAINFAATAELIQQLFIDRFSVDKLR